MGLPKGTVYGILRTLRSVDFVEHDPKVGEVPGGARPPAYGEHLSGRQRAAGTGADLVRDWLAAHTNESVRLGIVHEGHVLLVHHVFRPDNSPQALEVGALLPVHATAMGKVLLAHHRYLAAALSTQKTLARFTRCTITDPQRLIAELEKVREYGWASAVGEFFDREATCAAPIFDRRGIAVGAIAISGPIKRICQVPSRAPSSSPWYGRVHEQSLMTSERCRGNAEGGFVFKMVVLRDRIELSTPGWLVAFGRLRCLRSRSERASDRTRWRSALSDLTRHGNRWSSRSVWSAPPDRQDSPSPEADSPGRR